jgi:RimJ/RimL family protein N-acetyltransferase
MIPDQLQTANLFMRPFVVGDESAVHAYWKSDPGWEKFNKSVPSGFTERDANDFVAEMSGRDRNEQPHWALLHSETVVGVISLSFEAGYRTASVGYGIHADLRGRGLCVEAVKKILDSAFSEYPELGEIRAHTDKANSASIRVLQKMGFLEASHAGDGGQTFCLLRSDWGGSR